MWYGLGLELFGMIWVWYGLLGMFYVECLGMFQNIKELSRILHGLIWYDLCMYVLCRMFGNVSQTKSPHPNLKSQFKSYDSRVTYSKSNFFLKSTFSLYPVLGLTLLKSSFSVAIAT